MSSAAPTVRFVTGPTILLSSGNYFDILDPGGSLFTVEDIAHGLSNVCRFAGQCRQFYSVAQHSVLVSQVVEPTHAFAGLMHDASEAFIGDVTKPLKVLLTEYSRIEHLVEAAISERFGVPNPLPPEVKEADVRMLATEQRVLIRNRDDWDYCRGREPYPFTIDPLTPTEARHAFLARFYELQREANGRG